MPKKPTLINAAQNLMCSLEQRKDLTEAIDTLLDDIEAGRKYMKVYRQMKMYNDPSTNPCYMARRGNDECVLVTRFSALGDVAMTLPVVYGACAANPAHISLCSHESSRRASL